jgi:hypothetical protein
LVTTALQRRSGGLCGSMVSLRTASASRVTMRQICAQPKKTRW